MSQTVTVILICASIIISLASITFSVLTMRFNRAVRRHDALQSTEFVDADCSRCESKVLAARAEAGNFAGSLVRRHPSAFCQCGNKRCPRTSFHGYACMAVTQ